MYEFNVILDFMPEYNKPTGDANTTTIDWNTLMPVVEKIEGMGYKTTAYCYRANDHSFHILDYSPSSHGVGFGDSKIESVYKAVLEFIHRYNSTQNKEKV